MTNEEKRKRINELEKNINEMRKERDKYEKELAEEKRDREVEKRKEFIGKCFVIDSTETNYSNENAGIKAFKVLEILDSPNERYAKCLVLYDGYYGCWNDKSIKIMVVGLWTPNKRTLMSNFSDKKVIDYYDEIPQEQFETLYREYVSDIEQYVYL